MSVSSSATGSQTDAVQEDINASVDIVSALVAIEPPRRATWTNSQASEDHVHQYAGIALNVIRCNNSAISFESEPIGQQPPGFLYSVPTKHVADLRKLPDFGHDEMDKRPASALETRFDINPEDRCERIGEWTVVAIARQIEHGSAVSDDYGLE